MFLKKLDMLSPYITLYFKGEKKHSSRFSGVLSVVAYILIFITGVYYILNFIKKKDPKAYFFNRYVEDAGNFPLNSSSMFNYIQICNQTTNQPIPFDFSSIRIIGTDEGFSDEIMNDPKIILTKSHWLYGYCNNDSDIEGIEDIIDFSNFEKSSCIRKYYNKTTKTYYNTGEKGFRWPIIEKGCSHPNRTFYGIIMQRCDEVPELIRAQGMECRSSPEISDFITHISLKFEIIDNYPDILNYKTPLMKYFYEVTSAITNGIFIVNHLNFNPVSVLSHKGLFFDDLQSELSYIFVQNEKHTIDASILAANETTNGCLIGIYFWMQNTLQLYERIYIKLQDSLSDIGGMFSVIETVCYLINMIVHNFIIVLDTEDLVINRDNDNFNERNRKRRPSILKKATRIGSPPKRHIICKNLYKIDGADLSSNSSRGNIDNFSNGLIPNNKNNSNNNNIIDNKNNKNNFLLDNSFQSHNINNKVTNASLPEQNDIDYKKNNEKKEKGLRNIIKKEKKEKNQNNKKVGFGIKKKYTINLDDKKIQEKIDDIDKRPIEKQNFNFCKYILYLVQLRNKDHKIFYYENFRAKLISEENIIQSYLDIYKLLESYKLFKSRDKN